jgi:RHS repeat-associated protein
MKFKSGSKTKQNEQNLIARARLSETSIVIKGTTEKESMKLNRQSSDSTLEESPNHRLIDMRQHLIEGREPMIERRDDPQAELREMLATAGQPIRSMTRKALALFRVSQKWVNSSRQALGSAVRWISVPKHLRQVLVSFLALIILAQPNLALAQALTAPTAYDRARQAALAASLPATSDSWLTKVARQVPDPLPLLASVASLSRAAFFLIFPFDAAGVESGNVRQPASPKATVSIKKPALIVPLNESLNEFARSTSDSSFAGLLARNPVAHTDGDFAALIRPVAVYQSVSNISDGAISRQTPNLNNGRIEGNLRVFEGNNFNINGGFQLTQDLFVVGSPTIRTNGNSSYGGTVNDGGSATPSNYTVTLNGNVTLPGKIHIRADAIALPSDIPASVPQPQGTRDININNAGDVNSIGNWATVRDLNVNVANLTIDVPPGNYRQFTLNGSSRLNFANGTYNFSDKIHINGGSSVQATGLVTITVGQTMDVDGGAINLGADTSYNNVKLNALGSALNLNNNTNISAFIRAPNASVHLNGNSRVRGQVIAGQLHMNGGQIIGDSTAPSVSITSPAANSTTTQATITVSGTATDSGVNAGGVARVLVNNTLAVYNATTGAWSIANVPLAIGANTITARVEDNFGNTATTQITVTRQQPAQDTTPPVVAITSPANNSTTQAESITVSGTVSDPSPNATGIASVTVNGVTAARDVVAGTWSLANVALVVGANTITARATDNANNVATQSITVTRQPVIVPDTTPPVVTITSPANNSTTGNTSITVTGTAVDPGSNATGVARVFVNGVEATFDAGSGTWTATGVSLQQGSNRIVAEAEDRANPRNVGNAEISLRRVSPPQLTITNPLNGSVISASSVTVAGNVTTGASDISVAVTVNNQQASIAGGQYTKSIALTNGTNTITVVATDSLNQTAQSSVTVVSDQTPPTVSLADVPVTVQPGGTYTIRADASDNIGLTNVEFAVDGQPVVTVLTAPYQFTLLVPSNATPNQTIVITATARDTAGLSITDTQRTRVAGQGGVSGYVFDDATGYGIDAAQALFSDGAQVISDTTGSFSYVSASSVGLARFVKTGYTIVERAYKIDSGGGTSLFDARLTKLSSTANLIGATGGTAAGDNGRLQVVLGAGAFPDGSDVRLTSVSPQGLINLLPFGWSPVPGAVIDLRRSDPTLPLPNAFTVPARLTINETAGLAANTPVVLARYNESTHNWIVVSANLLAGANGALQADLPNAGQYAFLVADTGVTTPPLAVVAQPLPSSTAAESALLDQATAFATSSPRSALMSAEARSTITFYATAPQKLPSGVAIEANFNETYNLLAQTNPLLIDRPAQDFVLYSYPAATQAEPNRLGAFFIAKPTRVDLTITQLRSANVHITIRSGRPAESGALIGTTGGQVTTPDGETSLEIPSGALPTATPIFIEKVAPADAGLQLPAGYEIVGAVNVDTSGVVLASSGTLSVPSVTGDTSRIVVAKVMSIGGHRSPKVMARATEVNGKLRSTIAAPIVPAGITLSGITVSGLYVFIRVPAAFGYVKGLVTASGSPASMVRVALDRTPFVDVTGTAGQYVTIGAVSGTNILDAVSLITDATGTATAQLAAQDAVADQAIAIASVALTVQAVTPANNATNVTTTSVVSVTFNKPILATTLTGSSFRLTTAAGNPVIGNITVLAGNRVAVFTPASTLAGSTTYKATLTTAVLDLYGTALGAAFESSFTTSAAVTVENRLKPEKIKVGYPNAQGFVTVTIAAGAVPLGSTIVVINNSSGATVTTIAGSTEISLQIQAQVGDEIKVLVHQPDNVEYSVSQAAYKRDDGFTTVGRNGGAVTSADGANVLTIPNGAISGQVNLKLTQKVEADIPIPRQNEMDPANMPFGAGIQIEAQGSYTVEKELHLELPAPANATEGQRVAFIKPSKITESGQEVDIWEAVTSGRVEGGKFKTNSPPFFGLAGTLAPITLIWVFMPIRQRVVYGRVKEPVSATDNTLVGVSNVLCVLGDNTFSGLANHLTARTNREGYYSIFDIRFQEPTGSFVHALDDTNGRRGVGAPAQSPTIEARFLQGLQGFVNYTADITLPARGGGGGTDRTPPQLSVTGRSTNGAIEQDPLVQTGTVQVPGAVGIIVRTNKLIEDIQGAVLIGNSFNSNLTWRLDHTDGQSQIYVADLPITSEGSYSIVVKGFTVRGDQSTMTQVTYNFVALRNPNIRPPLEGAPKVLTTSPTNGASDIDVTTEIRIEFSEPVVNLIPGQTVYLQEEGQTDHLDGTITSGGVNVQPDTPNISSIVFRPTRTLNAGKRYCLHVTTEVRDMGLLDPPTPALSLDQDISVTGNQEYSGCFTTFGGFVLNDPPVADSGFRIVVIGSYAITLVQANSASSTLTVYDITNPQSPERKGNITIPQRALDVAVSEAVSFNAGGKIFTRIAAVTTNNLLHPEQQANLWFINLDEVDRPEIVGVTSLYVVEQLPTTPLSVFIQEGRAYVGNAPYRGVIEVDIQKAINLFAGFSDPLIPIRDAVTPNRGFAFESKLQSIRYTQPITEPSGANSLAALRYVGSQFDDVVFAAHTGAKQLVTLGFQSLYDGFNDFLPGDTQPNFDRRLVSVKNVDPPDSSPIKVRAVSDVLINGQPKKLVLMLGHNRMWIFDVTTNTTQYTSRTFAFMGVTGNASASTFEIEGTLAYVAMDDRVVVIDFSDPNNPRSVGVISGVGSGVAGLAVKDGFVFTLSPGNGVKDGLNVSIARPASTVFVHGYSPNNPDLLCSTPVIIDRGSRIMKQDAEIYFQIFGQQRPTSAKVAIKKNGVPVTELNAELMDTGQGRVVKGRALWRTEVPINATDNYTAEVIFNQGDFRAKPEPIPFSFLISDFMNNWSVPINGDSAKSEEDNPYFYVVTANSKVTLTINGLARLANIDRAFGLHIENKDTLGNEGVTGGLAPGRYSFTLRAQVASEPGIVDQVQGNFIITKDPDEVRAPGHSVIAGVDIFSGNLGLSYNDFEVRNRGLSLSLTRSYNTAAADSFSPFGYGWRHNYQVTLLRSGTKLVVRGGDGEGETFTDPPVGVETRANDPHQGRIIKNTDGSYDFYTKARIRYHFPGAFESGQANFFDYGYMGNLDYIEEPHGNRLDLFYDNLQRLERVKDSSEREIRFTYEQAETPFVGIVSPLSQSGVVSSCVRKGQLALVRNRILKSNFAVAWRITKIVGPGGLDMRYEYDIDGNLFKVTRKGADDISEATQDAVWQYGYKPTLPQGNNTDVTHIIKSVQNPNAHSTTYDYNFSLPGIFASQIDYPEQVSNTFTYTLTNGIVTGVMVKDGNGTNTNYTIARTSAGTTETIATPASGGTATSEIQFNKLGLKVSERDAEGMVTEYAYDDFGNPRTVSKRGGNGDQLSTRYTFDTTFSKPLSVTDPRGKVTRYDLNAQGDVILTTLPTGSRISFTMKPNGDIDFIKNERGLETHYSYDAFGNSTTIQQDVSVANRISTTNTYDLRSRLKTSSSTLGAAITSSYDALDHVKTLSATDPAGFRDGYTTNFTYTPFGQIERAVTNGGGQTLTLVNSFDNLERLLSISEAGGGIPGYTRQFTYDKNSNLKTETDRRGVTTTHSYNELNFATRHEVSGSFTPAAASVIIVQPDFVGNPKSQTDLYGNLIAYDYDGFHRLIKRSYTGKGNEFNYEERLRLDENGNALEVTDKNGHSSFMSYDPLNRVASMTDAVNRTTTLEYSDTEGKTTVRKAPQGLTVETVKDAAGRPLSERIRFGATEYVTAYSYNGRDVVMTDPRGTVTTRNLSGFGDVGRASVAMDGNTTLTTETRYTAFSGIKSHKDANNRTSTFAVDVLGRTTQATYPAIPDNATPGEVFAFDGEGLLLAHTDRRGVAFTMTYDNLRRPLATTMGGIRIMSHAYNDGSRTDTKTDANNHATICEYDGLMRVKRETNADSKSVSYTYDGVNLRTESDFKNKQSEYLYDNINRLVSVKDRTASQLTTIIHTDAGGHTTDTTDRRGNHRLEVYDPLGRIGSVTAGGQSLASFEYDGNSNRTAMVDGRNNRTQYEYDRLNRLIRTTHAGSLQVETLAYDGVGNLLRHNDGFGADVLMSYDGLNHPLTQTNGAGNVTRLKYDGEGLLRESIEPKGDPSGLSFKTSYQYNALRSLKEVRDARGGVWTYGYDDGQNLTSIVDAMSRVTSYEYDALDRVRKVTQPGTVQTLYDYDDNSNRTRVVDPLGQQTMVAYDDLDRVRQVDYVGQNNLPPARGPQRQVFGYDPEGNLTSVEERTVLNGSLALRNYARTYDARDRLLSATDANNKTVQYGYDTANNLTSLTDADSKVTGYGYDAMNRLARVEMTGNRVATYSWKANGLMESVSLPSGLQRSYGYDSASRLTSVTNNLGGADSEQFSYTYDDNSNRVRETRRRNSAIYRDFRYDYDELDRLASTSYEEPAERGLLGEYFNNRDFTGLALSRRDATVNFSWPGAQTPDAAVQDDTFSVRWTGKVEAEFTEDYTFYVESDEAVKLFVNGQLLADDANDHTLRETSGTIHLEAGKKYDIKIEYSENTGDAAVKLSWSSQSRSKQVIPASKLSVPLTYEYDAVGNRLKERGLDYRNQAINRAYSYNDLNRLQQVTGDNAGAISFQYDANGNLTSQTQGSQTTTYEYDVQDQLRRVSRGAGEVASYDYDFSRRRLSKTASGATTSYVYDGSKVINEYGTTGALQNRYDYGVELLRGELSGEGERFYFSDGLGSTTALSAITGTTASAATRYEYDAWGVQKAATASANRVGYTGQRLDEETGLMALGNGERNYQPQFGNFLQQDSVTGSISDPQSLNRYSYVSNNPLSYTDPTGHQGEEDLLTRIRNVIFGNPNVPVNAPTLVPFLDPNFGKALGELNRKIQEKLQDHPFVRGVYNSTVGGFAEMALLNDDLLNTARGVNFEPQSQTYQAYNHYRNGGDSAELALLKVAGGFAFAAVTFGVGPLSLNYYELKAAKDRGELSQETYDEALWELAGEATGTAALIASGALLSRLGKWARGKAMVWSESLSEASSSSRTLSEVSELSRSITFAEESAGEIQAARKYKFGELREKLLTRAAELESELGLSAKEARLQAVEDIRAGRVCFVAGTLVETREGKKPIEEIKVGDEVLSYNEQTAKVEYKPVVQTFTHQADEVLNVKIEGEREALGVTPQHPFYVRRARDCTANGDDEPPSRANQTSRGEWVAAGQLQTGDLVRRPNGSWARVEKVEQRVEGERVYNFEVADNHTYFVGEHGVLVHNTCKTWQEFERRVADLYGGKETFSKRTYQTIVDGEIVSGVADNVAEINGQRTAVEAKFVNKWESSIRNPQSPMAQGKVFAGGREIARDARVDVLAQARKYSAAFDQVIYHSNSPEFINYYSRLFQRYKLNNVRFVLSQF